jgi:polysaccharide export outer membrane protein
MLALLTRRARPVLLAALAPHVRLSALAPHVRLSALAPHVRLSALAPHVLLVALALLGGCANHPPGGGPTAAPASAAPGARPAQWGDPPATAAAPASAGAAAPTSAAGAIAATAAGAVTAPAAPGTAAPAGTPGGAADPAYRIGAEDTLEIAVWRDETLRATVVVRPDGAVTFPLVGEVQVAGRTAAEVLEELTRRLDRFVPEPVVTVNVARVASYRVYVLGRVNRPGDFAVGRHIDVLQALALAGGLTPFADEDGIRIIRRVQGRSVALPFQYSRVRRAGDLSQNVVLQSGDVLVVP